MPDTSATHHEPLVLGIDSSTTSCKAVVWDRHGNAAAEGRAALTISMPRPLWHEQDAETWWEAAVSAIRQATGQIDGRRLAGMCITAQRETFVPVDAAGIPLRPAILWMDERCGSLLPQIDREYGGERIHRLTGKPLSGNLTLGKIAWLRAEELEVFARTARYLDVAGFLVGRLTGAYHSGWGCVDPMGLFDIEHGRWAEELLAYLGIAAEQLPEAFPPGAIIGAVTPEAARACGLPSGLPVIAGVGDGQAGGIAAEVTGAGRAYLALGTSVVSGTHADAYITDRAFRTMVSAVPGAFSLETVILGGTYTVSWFLSTFGGGGATPAEAAHYEAAIAEIPAGAEGLLLVPYWNSAMNPYWDPRASGIVVGWRGIHTAAHLYRAILEGIALEQRLHTEGVEAALGHPVREYVVMGGGARSELWRGIIADVTGKPVRRVLTMEAAALGAGMQAAAGVGLFEDVDAAAAAMGCLEPDPLLPQPERNELYTRVYEDVYRHLFPALQPYLGRLTQATQGSAHSRI